MAWKAFLQCSDGMWSSPVESKYHPGQISHPTSKCTLLLSNSLPLLFLLLLLLLGFLCALDFTLAQLSSIGHLLSKDRSAKCDWQHIIGCQREEKKKWWERAGAKIHTLPSPVKLTNPLNAEVFLFSCCNPCSGRCKDSLKCHRHNLLEIQWTKQRSPKLTKSWSRET